MSTTFDLQLRGTRVPAPPVSATVEPLYEIKERYELNTNRAASQEHHLKLQEDIVGLVAEDNVTWYGFADELPEVYGEEPREDRSGRTGFLLPETLDSGRGSSRGLAGKIRAKFLEVIGRRSLDRHVSGMTVKLAAKVDDHNTQQPGLRHIDRHGNIGEACGPLPAGQQMLLFIHGTNSNFQDGFRKIAPRYWEQLHNRYGGKLYAFNHRTLTESPVKNALELLALLPQAARIDMITHSRGGLVGDVLARCDRRLPVMGYAPEEIDLVRKDYDTADGEQSGRGIAEEMEELAGVADGKGITINRIVRVACPAQGTYLLGDRLDHYLNALLIMMGKVGGDALLGPGYGYFKSLLLAAIEEREKPESLPGLYAMVPDKAFIKVNNNPTLELPSELVSIVGDADVGGGLLQSLKIILSNLYYWQQNDLVVHTFSMSEGIAQRAGNRVYRIEGSEVDHFSYFDEEEHMEVIAAVLTGKALPPGAMLRDRDTLPELPPPPFKDMIELDELLPVEASGHRPIVVLLPGIMGSNLYYDKERQWIDLPAMYRGGFVDRLGAGSDGVSAKSVIKSYYQPLSKGLQEEAYDVVLFPYDWRISLQDTAREFDELIGRLEKHGQDVQIVAHSMGGLVVRQWMFDYGTSWARYRERPAARVVLLGTPWRGSHLITEVLTGHSSVVRQLALLDFAHDKRELLEAIGKHRGIFELLPLDDEEIRQIATWREMASARNSRKMAPIDEAMLQHFRDHREKVIEGLRGLGEEDYRIVHYVAGHDEETVDGFRYKQSWFWTRPRLEYLVTGRGDGSVSWDRGIPAKLPHAHRYYTRVQHGKLAQDTSLIPGIIDLLRKGTTSAVSFSRTEPTTRSRGAAVEGARALRRKYEPIAGGSLVSNLLGESPLGGAQIDESPVIRVSVFNGDLKWARYPVMVGHFGHDGIVSAERALDDYLGNILTERHMMGFYPAEIGEQDVIVDYARRPRGAIIVGLGDKEGLTGYNLSRTVEKGVLKYAVFNRDNQVAGTGDGISCLLLGSNYGQLPLRESLRSIIYGVQQANKLMKNFGGRDQALRPVTFIEFVDFYEDRAYECFKLLKDIESSDSSLTIGVKRKIDKGFGLRKRFLREDSRSWWQTFTTRVRREAECRNGELVENGPEYLDYSTYDRGSSVSVDDVRSNLDLARFLADELSTQPRWDGENAKVIFELLIPNRYKDFIRNHRNIAWRMDLASATFPWEMFHDALYDEQPTFTKSGLIRQLVSPSANLRPALVRENTALVIADPEFTDVNLPQLPAAAEEGKEVREQLQAAGFTVNATIHRQPLEIVKQLFYGRHKVVHIASHGLFDPGNERVGIAIGGGQLLTPGTLRQLTAVPELVFVNCCYVGQIDPKQEYYRRHRHRLAANVGTQLIELGVKAVVVAGWAVDDAAAKTFAITFYKQMLEGSYFGEAVLAARRACYTHHGEVNTWGAYQCYGDQFYRCVLVGETRSGSSGKALLNELLLQMDNLISESKSIEVDGLSSDPVSQLRSSARGVLSSAEPEDIDAPELRHREAQFYTYLADYAKAIECYRALFDLGGGEYPLAEHYTYCNIRAKQLVVTAGRERLEQEEIARQLEEILTDLQFPASLRLGSELSATVGSTYKRAAVLLEDEGASQGYLEVAAEHYLQAARDRGTARRDSIYFVTRFLTLSALLQKWRGEEVFGIEDALGQSAASYLDSWIERADSLQDDRTSVYSQLAEIQLCLCRLVVQTLEGKLKPTRRREITDHVIALYRKQLSESINIRELHGEIEHMQFLLRMEDRIGGRALLRPHLEGIERVLLGVLG